MTTPPAVLGRPPGDMGPHDTSRELIQALRSALGTDSNSELARKLGADNRRISKLARGRAPARLRELLAWADRGGVRSESGPARFGVVVIPPPMIDNGPPDPDPR